MGKMRRERKRKRERRRKAGDVGLWVKARHSVCGYIKSQWTVDREFSRETLNKCLV